MSEYKSLIADIKKYGTSLPYTCIIQINISNDQPQINDILLKAISNILLVIKCSLILITTKSTTDAAEFCHWNIDLDKFNVPVFIQDYQTQDPLDVVVTFLK